MFWRRWLWFWQKPVVTFGKQIQWKWPNIYGEDKTFGGLHIEMATLKTIGDWLQGIDWIQALVQAEISVKAAESFLRSEHVARTRSAHQITAAALYILQHRSYDCYCQREFVDSDESNLPDVEYCCQQRATVPIYILGNVAGVGTLSTGPISLTSIIFTLYMYLDSLCLQNRLNIR